MYIDSAYWSLLQHYVVLHTCTHTRAHPPHTHTHMYTHTTTTSKPQIGTMQLPLPTDNPLITANDEYNNFLKKSSKLRNHSN